jgi:phage terminase large subunit-like protein
MKRISAPKSAPVQLTWSHMGVLYRATAWPDVAFEEHREGKWIAFDPEPASDVFAAAAVMLGRSEWKRYLEYVPESISSLLMKFRTSRMAALSLLVRCPELAAELEQTPALASFLAHHQQLRGGSRPAWGEISAVYERTGIYGLLEWLGLPASKDTLEGLARLVDPEIPKRLLERVREVMWNPIVTAQLIHSEPSTRKEVATQLEVLAA